MNCLEFLCRATSLWSTSDCVVIDSRFHFLLDSAAGLMASLFVSIDMNRICIMHVNRTPFQWKPTISDNSWRSLEDTENKTTFYGKTTKIHQKQRNSENIANWFQLNLQNVIAGWTVAVWHREKKTIKAINYKSGCLFIVQSLILFYVVYAIVFFYGFCVTF